MTRRRSSRPTADRSTATDRFPPFGPTPADVIREIERLVDVGVSHFQVSFDEMRTYRRFIDEVLPIVRLERHPQALA